jgi:large conductance mechanosensitive channel
VIVAAFGKVIDGLVKYLITPLLAIPGDTDFSDLTFDISGSRFFYGAFLNELISFLMIALAIFLFVVKPMNMLIARRNRGEEPANPTERDCPECLSTIPIAASRCAFCTAEVAAA